MLIASVFCTGCWHVFNFVRHPINETFARHSDPTAGWKFTGWRSTNEVITADYQDYIQKLPSKIKDSAFFEGILEDGTGQHAAKIRLYSDGTVWVHVLIYDRSDRRIKVIKYVYDYDLM